MPHFNDPTTRKMVDFIVAIGIPVEKMTIEEETFLPGILVKNGGLSVDESKLLYPGDLLHEAGHLATLTPEKRASVYNDVSKNAGDEIATLAWSYAAAVHLGLDPRVVFHDNGYKKDARWLAEHFSEGGEMGVPLMEWMQLSWGKARAAEQAVAPFPHMVQWLRG